MQNKTELINTLKQIEIETKEALEYLENDKLGLAEGKIYDAYLNLSLVLSTIRSINKGSSNE
ncbi:MAG: hypothetical protein LBQ34_02910 [Alphaproteobacteria bacterium]|jgi:hypothetical protein|nr:hypothetical protein [Alphaproteobacteria bacterium]